MSGTSFDAIDAAWVDFSDSGQPVVVDFESSPISHALRANLSKLQSPSFNDLHQSQLVAIQHADETAQVVCRLIERQQRSPIKLTCGSDPWSDGTPSTKAWLHRAIARGGLSR